MRRSLSWRVRDPGGARFDVEARPVIDPGPGEHSELMRDLHRSTVLRMAPEMLRSCPWVVAVLPGGRGRSWHSDEGGTLHLRHALGYCAARDLHAHVVGIMEREGLPGMPRTVAGKGADAYYDWSVGHMTGILIECSSTSRSAASSPVRAAPFSLRSCAPALL